MGTGGLLPSSPQGAGPCFQHKPFLFSYSPLTPFLGPTGPTQAEALHCFGTCLRRKRNMADRGEEGARSWGGFGWSWPVEQRGWALVSQTLSSAVVSASCNVIVLWYHHQQAQLSCPTPCCSSSQERKLSLFCTVRLCFRADDCIWRRHCVWLEEARLSERFQRGGFGITAPETGKWLYYLAVSPQRYKPYPAAWPTKGGKGEEGWPHLSPSCGFPLSFSAETMQETQFKFAWVLIQTGDTRPWSPAHCYDRRSAQGRTFHSLCRKCTSWEWVRSSCEVFLAVLFGNSGEGDSSSLPRWAALWPWVEKQGLASKLLEEHKVPEPQEKKKKWASHKLHLWMYHNVVSCFPSDASKSGPGQITLLLSFPQTFMGGPTEISPSLAREWKNALVLFLYLYFLFGLSYLEISLYKNTLQCHLFPWAEFVFSSAEMLYKCYTLTVVLEQLSESSEKVTEYKLIEAFRPSIS